MQLHFEFFFASLSRRKLHNMGFEFDRTNKCYKLFRDVKCHIETSDEHSLLTGLNLDKMHLHILECLNALSYAKTLCREAKRKLYVVENLDILNDEYKKLETVKDNVFASAISAILDDKSPYKEQRDIIQVYSYCTLLNDDVGWLTLHWAIACGNTVTEQDVKTIYAADPMALSKRHLKGYPNAGCTPISLLLMSKKPNMSLLSFFLKIHPGAFIISVGGIEQHYREFQVYPLHIAAKYSESVEVLQKLLQVDTKITSTSTNASHYPNEFALGLLCKREEFPGFRDMLSCLLIVDSSTVVIENAISYVITAERSNSLTLIEMLLKANPEAAKCSHRLLLHETCEHIKGDLCLQALSLFIAIEKDAIMDAEEDYNEYALPVHAAAACNTVEVLEFLLNEYPESALASNDNDNLLHFAIKDKSNGEAKVKLLTTAYPKLLRMHNEWGLTPLLDHLFENRNPNMRIFTSMIAADDTIVMQGGYLSGRVGLDEIVEWNNHLSLPLHVIVNLYNLTPILSAVSETADIIRLLISLYPEAISVKNCHEKHPYDYAVEKKLNPYFIRILLRGDPTINSPLLYDLNYKERRLAMFLAFSAVTRTMKVSIWASLRYENKDLLKKVISFL